MKKDGNSHFVAQLTNSVRGLEQIRRHRCRQGLKYFMTSNLN